MARLANIVTVNVKPGKVDAVVAALLAHKERSLKGEPGTMRFEVLRPRGDDSKLMTYEVYEDEAAFEAHRSAPSLAELLRESGNMISELQGIRCSLID
jgi:(4S)-4-hydroxy-5-phosphonooxypentane-2,3-dione isomerase